MTSILTPPTAPPRPTLATKVAWNGAAGMVAAFGSALAGILAARLLGAEGMGELAFLVWSMETTAQLVELGLGRALTRFVAETRSRGLARWLARRMILLTVAGAALFAVATPWIGRGPVVPLHYAVAALLFLVRGVEAVGRAYLAGTQDFRRLARINVASAAALVLGVGIGGVLGGLPGVLLGYVASSAVGAAVVLRLLRDAPAETPSRAVRGRVRRFATWAWIGALVALVSWSQLEILFLERLASAAAVGYFAVGLRVTRLATALPLLIGGVFVPHFAERLGAGDHDAVRRGYAAGTRALALLLFPLCFGLAGTAPLVVPLLYGPEFAGAVPVAVVLCLASALAVQNVGASLILGLEKSQVRALWALLAAVLTVVALTFVVPAYGAWGAAWVRLLVRVVVVAIAGAYIARALRVPVPLRALGRILLAASLCGALAAAVCAAWPSPFALPLAVLLGAVAYAGALRRLHAVDPEDAAAFLRFADRLPARLRGPARLLVVFVGGR